MSLKITHRSTDNQLRRKVREISGENFGKCFQCGTCSGSCPMTEHLNVLPRQLMAFLQLGHQEGLSRANTPWICASCHLCMVRCPRGIDIPRIMEAVRQVKLRSNVDEVAPYSLEPEEIVELPQIAMVSGFRKLTS